MKTAGLASHDMLELMVTSLVLLRHGQSTWNLHGRLQGQTMDVELTELGVQQAQNAAEQLAASLPAGTPIFSSDQRRAQQTAEIVAAALVSQIHFDARLREQDLGEMTGKLASELSALPTPTGQHISEIRWGGGESVADVYQRSLEFLAELPAVPRAIIVGHGDALRILAAAADGRGHRDVDYDLVLDNAEPLPINWSGAIDSPVGDHAASHRLLRMRSDTGLG